MNYKSKCLIDWFVPIFSRPHANQFTLRIVAATVQKAVCQKKATLFIKLQRAVAIKYIISDIRLCGLFFALVARILDLLLKLQFVVIIYLFICHIGDCYLVCSVVCVDMCLQLALATERGNTCCIGQQRVWWPTQACCSFITRHKFCVFMFF